MSIIVVYGIMDISDDIYEYFMVCDYRKKEYFYIQNNLRC